MSVLPHLCEDVLRSVGPLPGDLLLGGSHAVLEINLPTRNQFKYIIKLCGWSEFLCSIPDLLVLHGGEHPVLPPAPGQHHHLLLLEQEEQHCPCTARCSTQVQ